MKTCATVQKVQKQPKQPVQCTNSYSAVDTLSKKVTISEFLKEESPEEFTLLV